MRLNSTASSRGSRSIITNPKSSEKLVSKPWKLNNCNKKRTWNDPYGQNQKKPLWPKTR